MCGIVGFKQFDCSGSLPINELNRAVESLASRGPDARGIYLDHGVGLGHTRLSIMDISTNGNQPMTDPSGRCTLVFNGEIYNHKPLRNTVKNTKFCSTSDTEVLLHLLMEQGEACLTKLNGFFSFVFYDKEEDSMLLVRDPMGIKPLHIYRDDHQLLFGSELKALLHFSIPRTIDHEALYWYLKLSYLPGALGMLRGVEKLKPGHYLNVKGREMVEEEYWKPKKSRSNVLDYPDSQKQLVHLLETSVKKRLMSDVPLGSFLSGGTDSSAIVALASGYHSNLRTFSIGYKDHPFFDETHYAERVAETFKTNHTTFSLTNDDLLDDLDSMLSYIDEPFADSSALPTYILSKRTVKHVKVALSGDGADELFGGYYKHPALSKSMSPSLTNALLSVLGSLSSFMPRSRSSKTANTFRRLSKYAKMLKLSPSEKYWFLASSVHHPDRYVLKPGDRQKVHAFKSQFLPSTPDFTDYLLADQQLVLPGDMLTKVDLMSMANSLEVRVPFLDKSVVAFANSLPHTFKVYGNQRKRILQDGFKHLLPRELYQRPKKGFEAPLLHLMQNELLEELDNVVFNEDYLTEQHLFAPRHVMLLREKLLSRNPQDVHGMIWTLYVFQRWHKKYIDR